MDKIKEKNIQTKDKEVELEVLPTPDYKKGYKEYMASLKEEAKKHGFELKFLEDVYPLRKMANWYQGAIAEIVYSDKISIMISAYVDDFEVKWVDGNPNDRFSTPKELESIEIFTDKDIENFLDNNIIDIENNGLFDFYITDEDRNFTGTYSDVVYDMDLGFGQASTLDYAFDFEHYKKNVIPKYLKEYGPQSQLEENNIKKDGEEVELEVIPYTNYKEGYKKFMQDLKNKAKAAGFDLTFEQDIYPKRSWAMWYYGALVTLKYSDRISIVISCNNEDLEMYFKDDDSQSFSDSFGFEEAGFFTDAQVREASDNDVIEFEGSEFIIFYIEDTEKDEVTYGSDMGYDDMYTLGEAFDFEFYRDEVIPAYLKENPAKGEDQRTDVQKTIDSLKEDKEGIKRFEDKFGKELSSRFFKLKPRLVAPENDISYWMKKDSKELTSKLDSLESTKTVKQKDEKAKEGAELLHSDENWSVYEILNVDASIKYGRDTKWCISGIDCETPSMWNKYKKTMPNFPEESSSFIFFIRKMYRDKYAVLFNKDTGEYLIWNSIDNPMAFIPKAPKVKGLPDFSRPPMELKRALAKGAGIPPTRILDIAPNFEEMFPDDHLEKYTIQYRDEDDILVSQGLYRSPETDEFEPLDYI